MKDDAEQDPDAEAEPQPSDPIPLPRPEQQGILVESGSFRVDRTRALSKLAQFQLPDASAFLLPWMRCAVLSGATQARLDEIDGGVRLRFNGRPLSRELLDDPYAALFDSGTQDLERHRHLAVGLLAALRLQPKLATAASGFGDDRVCLKVRSLADDALEPDGGISIDTVLTVVWDRRLKDGRIAGHLAAACELLEIPLFVDGKRLETLPDSETVPVAAFKSGTTRGVLVSTPKKSSRIHLLGHYEKNLHLYKYGVRVGTIEHEFPLAMEIHVNDDGFSLNASHSGVLEDLVFSAAMKRVEENTGNLLLNAAQEATSRSAGPRGVLSAYGLGNRQLPALLRLGAALRGIPQENMAELQWEARVKAWLRYVAARHLTDYEANSSHPALKALWETPLYLTVTGKTVSLLEIARQFESIRYVPYSDPSVHYPDAWLLNFEPSVHIIWRLDEYDDCLRRLFPGRLREWGALDSLWEIVKLPFRK